MASQKERERGTGTVAGNAVGKMHELVLYKRRDTERRFTRISSSARFVSKGHKITNDDS